MEFKSIILKANEPKSIVVEKGIHAIDTNLLFRCDHSLLGKQVVLKLDDNLSTIITFDDVQTLFNIHDDINPETLVRLEQDVFNRFTIVAPIDTTISYAIETMILYR